MGKIDESRRLEFEALKDIEGVNIDSLMEQAGLASGKPEEGAAAPQEETMSDVEKAAQQVMQQVSQQSPPAAGTPAEPTSEAGSTPDAAGILKEIFGDQFTSVDDLKKINIPEKLREAETLREQVKALAAEKEQISSQLEAKPKTQFVNDDLALFNEFVRETGVQSFDVFNRINSAEIANMDDMDAVVLTRLLETPELINHEPRLRKNIEKVLNVDSDDDGYSDDDGPPMPNINLIREGKKAKEKLLEIKGKLKIPETEVEPTNTARPEWTVEQKTQAEGVWSNASEAMAGKLGTLEITLPGAKVPLTNYAVPEEILNAVKQDAVKRAVGGQLGVTDDNITDMARYMYAEIILRSLGGRDQAIFEQARSLSEIEVRERYHNPSPIRPGDGAGEPGKPEAKTPEQMSDDITKAELERL